MKRLALLAQLDASAGACEGSGAGDERALDAGAIDAGQTDAGP